MHAWTASTHSSSTRYGGAPKEVFNATFTDGTALAPSTKPRSTVALVANRPVVFAMVKSTPGALFTCERIKTLRDVEMEVETWD